MHPPLTKVQRIHIYIYIKKKNLFNVRILQEVTGVIEQRQQHLCWQFAVTAAEALPALGLVDGDDLETQVRTEPRLSKVLTGQPQSTIK